ncbi:MAG: transcriptional repressor, partial [Helicobacteraceae bacterium]|jgi:Fur family peroxide stress response transcriptional regulator|nr:transcriptional repressor [Helicobacteraceae bacterium]
LASFVFGVLDVTALRRKSGWKSVFGEYGYNRENFICWNKDVDYKIKLNLRGLKATPQRIRLMEELANRGHSTIDAIYRALKSEQPMISLSTIYNNLSALTKRGLVKEVAIAGERQVFELAQKEHAHLICSECGEILDVDVDYEAIKKALKIPNGAKIDEGDLIFNGICARCAAKIAKANKDDKTSKVAATSAREAVVA